MLEITNLSKKYKNATKYSVKDLSFTLNEGEIFGFLGKNGAGKSTTIKCITGIIPFEDGKITICGYDIAKQPISAKLNIGYVPDNHAVYENLTGREYVTYMGNIYRVPKEIIEERIQKFGAKFSLTFALDNQIRSYSHGMKQKICIMAALVHNPKFWVLDEPLMGLDPQSAYEIKQYMLEHKSLGNTVFFSSHNLEIVEKICDRVAIINKGQLLEVIDVKKFLEESPISLEEYFLNKTKDGVAPGAVLVESEKERKKKISKMKKLRAKFEQGKFAKLLEKRKDKIEKAKTQPETVEQELGQPKVEKVTETKEKIKKEKTPKVKKEKTPKVKKEKVEKPKKEKVKKEKSQKPKKEKVEKFTTEKSNPERPKKEKVKKEKVKKEKTKIEKVKVEKPKKEKKEKTKPTKPEKVKKEKVKKEKTPKPKKEKVEKPAKEKVEKPKKEKKIKQKQEQTKEEWENI